MALETDNRERSPRREQRSGTDGHKSELGEAVTRLRDSSRNFLRLVKTSERSPYKKTGPRGPGAAAPPRQSLRGRASQWLRTLRAATADDDSFRSRVAAFIRRYLSSSLTRRIVFLNATALVLLLSGILYLNQFRQGLIDARVQSLLTQGEIIAGAIAQAATIDTESITIDPDRLLEIQPGETISPVEDNSSLDFPINPERAAPILRRLISPTKTWARIYDTDGELVVDSRNLSARGQIISFDLPPLDEPEEGFFERMWQQVVGWFFSSDLPIQKDSIGDNGRSFPEVVAALNGAQVSIVRTNDKHEIIVSVAVPVQRFRAILGALVLSTQGGDIDAIVHAERWAIVRTFLVLLGVTILLSFLLAGTIAEPMRRLARAAERVRVGSKTRVEIPDYTRRSDEIGHLSGALRDMTTALYNRIDGIESFAADVAHELKNPLTSLRSAVETLPLAKDETSRKRLIAIVQDDVKRLDRLISDISDASRLDAELARSEATPVNIGELLDAVVSVFNETRRRGDPRFVLSIETGGARNGPLMVNGHDSRLGQVVRNLIGNARSFSPRNGEIWVFARRVGPEIEIRVEDEGPGIRPENLTKIFDRFHTDRPGEDQFGKNSGLGLSISKQIVEAHAGRIWAENRHGDKDRHLPESRRHILGARFVVRLPARTGGAARPKQAEDDAAAAARGSSGITARMLRLGGRAAASGLRWSADRLNRFLRGPDDGDGDVRPGR